ncbi:hypothetical protein V1L54_11205 [Streptomyces sp. TRM 70361]|uniref:hypothetical protein n=1 Tax=Streptomyces sp. TRM 70361 TaxID=3116553 RepID=UPI002E7BDC95|nr:hypothetical protein [Streptomyces sp. TRM 70361]MEE1939968.1 hypothetical protein [Streptomyces sp. TRM 70361]
MELREDRHLLLVDLNQVIRGGDYVWVTLNFERADSLALQLHSQVPATDRPS